MYEKAISQYGRVLEWSNRTVLKTVSLARGSRVRISTLPKFQVKRKRNLENVGNGLAPFLNSIYRTQQYQLIFQY